MKAERSVRLNELVSAQRSRKAPRELIHSRSLGRTSTIREKQEFDASVVEVLQGARSTGNGGRAMKKDTVNAMGLSVSQCAMDGHSGIGVVLECKSEVGGSWRRRGGFV